jgi:hypothetical protein
LLCVRTFPLRMLRRSSVRVIQCKHNCKKENAYEDFNPIRGNL